MKKNHTNDVSNDVTVWQQSQPSILMKLTHFTRNSRMLSHIFSKFHPSMISDGEPSQIRICCVRYENNASKRDSTLLPSPGEGVPTSHIEFTARYADRHTRTQARWKQEYQLSSWRCWWSRDNNTKRRFKTQPKFPCFLLFSVSSKSVIDNQRQIERLNYCVSCLVLSCK